MYRAYSILYIWRKTRKWNFKFEISLTWPEQTDHTLISLSSEDVIIRLASVKRRQVIKWPSCAGTIYQCHVNVQHFMSQNEQLHNEKLQRLRNSDSFPAYLRQLTSTVLPVFVDSIVSNVVHFPQTSLEAILGKWSRKQRSFIGDRNTVTLFAPQDIILRKNTPLSTGPRHVQQILCV